MLPGRGAVRAIREDPLVEALVALGYHRLEAESAADEAKAQAESVEEQLKVALRGLAR